MAQIPLVPLLKTQAVPVVQTQAVVIAVVRDLAVLTAHLGLIHLTVSSQTARPRLKTGRKLPRLRKRKVGSMENDESFRVMLNMD